MKHDNRRYKFKQHHEAVNAMLLNEFLKEHRKVEEQEQTIAGQEDRLKHAQNEIAQLQSALAEQKKNFEASASEQGQEITAQTAGLQNVNERFESLASATSVAANN